MFVRCEVNSSSRNMEYPYTAHILDEHQAHILCPHKPIGIHMWYIGIYIERNGIYIEIFTEVGTSRE